MPHWYEAHLLWQSLFKPNNKLVFCSRSKASIGAYISYVPCGLVVWNCQSVADPFMSLTFDVMIST